MRLIFVLTLLITGTTIYSKDKDDLLIVFWNLENFFDYQDDGTGESDTEFSSAGSRRWTSKRFYQKCNLVAKSLFWTGDKYGKMPDVIGVAEVENREVLTRMLSSTLLRKYDYKIVHRDSKDRRGIDVALLYRSSKFELIDISYHTPYFNGEQMSTRDILNVRLRNISDGHIYDFSVNHHPSKYGGSKESESRRITVMEVLAGICDSLYTHAPESKYKGIVAMGDFNDNPSGSQFDLLEGKLKNACTDIYEKGEGSIRFEGRWDLIDMFWVSETMYSESTAEVLRIPFLMTRDRKHPGEKPLRTYSGPRYLGGVSDHCPVVLILD